MTTAGTWYPPAAGTGGFLLDFINPPFAPMTNDITATLQERGKRYGEFLDHARITYELKCVIRDRLDQHRKVLREDQLEALDMICHKIGRIINGDPNYADSWHDIAGYALLVADRLNKEQEDQP